MARKKTHPHLDVLLNWSPMSRRLKFPVDETTAAPVIKFMDHMLDPEILSQDGECPVSQQQYNIDMVLRAKGDLELILGRSISLDNQQDSDKYNAMGFNTFFTDTSISIKGKTRKLIEGLEAHDWAKHKLKDKYGAAALTCMWKCDKCALCKINHGKTIHICLH